jgi:hypothetical protein
VQVVRLRGLTRTCGGPGTSLQGTGAEFVLAGAEGKGAGSGPTPWTPSPGGYRAAPPLWHPPASQAWVGRSTEQVWGHPGAGVVVFYEPHQCRPLPVGFLTRLPCTRPPMRIAASTPSCTTDHAIATAGPSCKEPLPLAVAPEDRLCRSPSWANRGDDRGSYWPRAPSIRP